MIAMVPVTSLWVHEEFDLVHAVETARDIKEHGLMNAIIVDAKTYIVLDGHHRLVAYKILGLDMIPVKFVDLMDPKVVIEWRREEFENDTKDDIVARARAEKPYPRKTTRIFKVDENGNLRRLKEIV